MARGDDYSVADLERMLEARRLELGELEKRRDQLAAELAECDARIVELNGDGTTGTRRRTSRRRKVGRSRFRNQPSLKKVIVEVLQKSKKPLSVDDIVDKVLSTGYKSTADNFRQVTYLNLFNLKKEGRVQHDSDSKLYSASAS